MTDTASETGLPELAISPENVCFIAIKAREYDAKDEPSETDPASNPADDRMYSVLEDHPDDPVRQEIAAAIAGLSEDEQIDLVALAWLGRGDGDITDWEDLRKAAAEARTGRTWRYLLGLPLLSDYLEEGLTAFGLSCSDMERRHL
ncbi:DUF3775 domain-containing protein [Devosia nitrariae]|nr:DUF3775 domain-containing protein [Devosia nitrariae]